MLPILSNDAVWRGGSDDVGTDHKKQIPITYSICETSLNRTPAVINLSIGEIFRLNLSENPKNGVSGTITVFV
jgi:hypothetical protein